MTRSATIHPTPSLRTTGSPTASAAPAVAPTGEPLGAPAAPADGVGRVVVGLDGSGHSDQALEWAVADAQAQGRPLHLMHARETIVTAWSPMMVVPTEVDEEVWVVDEALARVRAMAPDLPVSGATTTGPAAAALAAAGSENDTLVVGARGRGVVGSILLGSTSLHVATHARCPVVVVRDTASEQHGGPATMATAADHAHTGEGTAHERPTGQTVVVGFDGSATSEAALGFAFAEAARRRLPLDIVSSWEPNLRETAELVPTVAEEVRAAAAGHHRDLAVSAAAPWREVYPSVDVRIHVTTEQPGPSLLVRSHRAALVVVGSRGLGVVRGPLLGSVSTTVLHGAHCPVAVVRSPTAH